MRVHITPTWNGPDKGDGGIRRVVEAQQRYLPEFGWQIVDDPRAADLIACHGAARIDAPGVPMICHSHGLMWEDYGFGDWGDAVNAALVNAMVRAQAITAPSQWVAHAISRGMLIRPEVIYHGVEVDEWAHDEPHAGYVLWNKARVDPVSDPADMQQLAALMPDIKFVSTFGQATRNVFITGLGSYEQMKPMVQRAGLYLATTRETMGIGTLEALAAGVPVVGWDYGGQHEIVRNGKTGYLAEFGNFDHLAECTRRALAERAALSRQARLDARERWGWRDKIQAYANLYDRVVAEWTAPRPKVSVVITCYNLGRYLNDAVQSVDRQTMKDYELIIVDDCSTEPLPMIGPFDRLKSTTLRTPHNLGLSGARNYGWQHATGKYILFLDADDMLDHNALDALATALDRDPGLHIAYGMLDTILADGTNQRRNEFPRGNFSWHAQLAHLNQLPYAALMRREVLERSGGYRTRDWRAEDASFWARVTSFGFRAARVTDDTTLIYRMHDGQKSRQEAREHADRDGDWTAWLPWRLAGSAEEGLSAMREQRQPPPSLVPFSAQGLPPTPLKAWPVRHHQHPIISVVIPVGPGHAELLIDALDSVQAQTFVEWEAIVVWDAAQHEHPMHWLAAYPWVRVTSTYEAGKADPVKMGAGAGAGAARNVGLEAARAPFVVFLDADDVLMPTALHELLRGYAQTGRYAYSDWITLDDEKRLDGPREVHEAPDYDERRMLHQLYHAVTALVPTEWVRAVGGFDEKLRVFEDWELFAKLATQGYHGARVASPLLVYRHGTGQRTRTAVKAVVDGVPHYTDLGEATVAAIKDRLAPWISGEEPIAMCCGSGPLRVASSALDEMMGFVTSSDVAVPSGTEDVRMEFIGDEFGAKSYVGQVSGRIYRMGRDPVDRYRDVDPRDVEGLLAKRGVGGNMLFRVVVPPRPETAPDAEAQPRGRGRKRG